MNRYQSSCPLTALILVFAIHACVLCLKSYCTLCDHSCQRLNLERTWMRNILWCNILPHTADHFQLSVKRRVRKLGVCVCVRALRDNLLMGSRSWGWSILPISIRQNCWPLVHTASPFSSSGALFGDAVVLFSLRKHYKWWVTCWARSDLSTLELRCREGYRHLWEKGQLLSCD